jgi:hypothetical protein
LGVFQGGLSFAVAPVLLAACMAAMRAEDAASAVGEDANWD